jgi:glutaminase
MVECPGPMAIPATDDVHVQPACAERPAQAWSPVQRYLARLHADCATDRSGAVADYIPELARAIPADFAICIATIDGRVYEVGDSRRRFTIQSISKPFTYGIALEDRGRAAVFEKIGVEPSGEAFNSISLEPGSGRPLNAMINAGAITATALVAGASAEERLARVLDVYARCAGRRLDVEPATFESERSTGHRNRAIGHMLRSSGVLVEDPEETLDLYFRQCSISVDCRDVSVMAATLANGGVHPLTGERALSADTVETVLSVMTTCGMYDGAGDWVERVGMPAKSGVSGGILAVLPGQLGVCVYSPLLDPRGNSVRGVAVCHRLARDLHLHFLHTTRQSRAVIRSHHDIASVPSKRVRTADERVALLPAGARAVVYELQGDLLFSGIERVVRDVVDCAPELDIVIVDLRAVSHVSNAAAAMLRDLHASLDAARKRLAFVDGNRDFAPGVPRFHDRDAATEWAENLLLGEHTGVPDRVELAECQLCEGLSSTGLAHLAGLLERRALAAGELAVRAGDPADEILILASGELSVMVESDTGGHRLATLAPGATFGELAIVGRASRTADVRADRDSELFVLRAADFERLADTEPNLQVALLRNLLRRAYEIVERNNREIASVVSP